MMSCFRTLLPHIMIQNLKLKVYSLIYNSQEALTWGQQDSYSSKWNRHYARLRLTLTKQWKGRRKVWKLFTQMIRLIMHQSEIHWQHDWLHLTGHSIWASRVCNGLANHRVQNVLNIFKHALLVDNWGCIIKIPLKCTLCAVATIPYSNSWRTNVKCPHLLLSDISRHPKSASLTLHVP